MRTNVSARRFGHEGLLTGQYLDGAELLGYTILTALDESQKGDLVAVDLGGVIRLDCDYAEHVYDVMLGGVRTSWAQTRFCRRRAGKGILFVNAVDHLDAVLRGVDSVHDVVAYRSTDGTVQMGGAAYGEVSEAIYRQVCDKGQITSSELAAFMQSQGFGATLANSSNMLARLYQWGLLARERCGAGLGSQRQYVYRPVDFLQVNPCSEEEGRHLYMT